LNPYYIPGGKDKFNGSVMLTLTAEGLASNGTCLPAIDSVEAWFSDPLITFIPRHLRCYNDNSGMVWARVTNGNAPYIYDWTGPAGFTSSNDTIKGLAAGFYYLTVTDAFGCQATDTVELTQPQLLVALVDARKNVSCFGGDDGAAKVSVTGGTADYTYQWSSVPQQTTAEATGLTAGEYTIRITDANNCRAQDRITISEPPQIVLSADSIDAKCAGGLLGSIDLTVSGGTPFKNEPHYRFEWTDETKAVVGTTEDLANLPGDMLYSVVVSDSIGCWDTLSIFINEQNDLLIIVENVDSILCFGDSNGAIDITVSNGTGPYTFKWDSGQTTEDLTGIAAGKYHVLATDANGCIIDMDFELYEPKELFASIVSTDFEICESDTLQIEGRSSGGTGIRTHLWMGDGAAYAVAANNAKTLFTGAPAGDYKLIFTATDANGCFAADTMDIKVLPITYNTVGDTICPSDLPFAWNGQVYDAAGTYINILKNVHGCDSIITYNLFVRDEFILTATTINDGTTAIPSGSIDLTVTGNSSPYTFNWSNGETTEDLSGLSAGDYFVTVTDANGCTDTLSVSVSSDLGDIIVQATAIPVDCYGNNSGAINLTVSGGAAPYTFSWSNGETTQNIKDLVADRYTVTVTDSRGSFKIVSATITEPTQLVLSATKIDVGDSPDPIGSINLSVRGGTKPYSFSWTGPNGFTASTEDLKNLPKGNYSVIVTDGNGCTERLTVVISGYGMTCPPPLFVDCSIALAPTPFKTLGEYEAAGGSITGNVDLLVATFTVVGPDVSDGNKCPETFTRTYTIQNKDGEWITCEQLIIVDDKERPKLAFSQKNVSCPENKPSIYTNQIQFEAQKGNSASDNCGLDWSTFKFIRESDDKETCPQTIVRWYEIFDMCGNRTEARENIIIHDKLRPVVYRAPKDIFAVCEPPAPYKNRNEFELIGGGVVTDNCNNFTITFVKDSILDGTCPTIIKRIYRAADFCDNSVQIIQTITINDTIAPTISCPAPVAFDAKIDDLKTLTGLAYSESVLQIATVSFKGVGIAVTDNCKVDKVTYNDKQTGICPIVVTRTFTVYDACGNSNTCQQEIKLLNLTLPDFAQFGPYCLNAVPDDLPTTSINGIKGTWSPAKIDTKTKGTKTYTFTPGPDQCASAITIGIEVTDEIKPVFAALGPFCVNSIAPALPLLSDNKIKGTWDPAKVETSTDGKFKYEFTPEPGQCAVPVIIVIEITDEREPLFAAIGPFCLNSVAPPLPPVSRNGITGTWDPAKINTATLGVFDYTFTPDPGQCAIPVTIKIEITDDIVPVFAALGPFCLHSGAQALPLVSDNGISGKWNPARVATGKVGLTSYRFTPDPGQCSKQVTIVIEITDEIVPDFDQLGPFCINSMAPALPVVSNNGISGKWNPAAVVTSRAGVAKYTFTPDPGQCANPFVMEIEVYDLTIPTFAQLSPQCPNTVAPELPGVSINGITGTWDPAFIETKNQGVFTFTFTPDSGQCSVPVKLSIDISDKIPPVAICQNITVYLDASGKASIATAQIDKGSYDNCALDTLFLDRYDFDCADIGKNTVRLTAVDYVGLTDYCDAIVTVIDTVKPMITCRGPFEIQLDANAQYKLTVAEVLKGNPFDACGIDTMYVYPDSLDCDHIGLTTITLWVVGVNGDSSYCESQVYIYGNRAPQVVDDSTTTKENIPVLIDVVANDYDEKSGIDRSSLRISIKPKYGVAKVNPRSGDVTYTPNHGFSGVDVFQYTICDDGIPCDPECGSAYVFVKVEAINDKPIALDDRYIAGCFSVSGNILDNDWDDDGTENLNVNTIPLYPPNHGEVTIDPDGMITYYPNDGFIGIDSFQYVICDNGIPSMCDTATVYIEVDCSMENPDPIECELFIPEGFSPNMDGIHDFFRIMCIEHYPDAKLMIFNRNGDLLWEKEHYGNYEYWGDQFNAWWWGNSVLSKFDVGKQMINGAPKVKFGNYVYVLQLGNGEVKNGTVMVAY
jgi:gliding motility-associated-like protein